MWDICNITLWKVLSKIRGYFHKTTLSNYNPKRKKLIEDNDYGHFVYME